MIGSLDIDGLRAFVAIVDGMSFSRAGEVIGRTQSAVSLRLRQLERALGVSLLVRRKGRLIEVTDSGHVLLTYARQIVELHDIAIRELAKAPTRDRVRVGLTADFLDSGFPAALKVIEALPGNFQLEVETDVSERLRNRCVAGDLDIAFYKLCGADGVGTPLASIALTWRAPPGFVLDLDEPVPLVCLPEGCAYRKAMLKPLQQAGIPYQIAVASSSLDTVRKAVAAGLGITALPSGDDTLTAVTSLPKIADVSLAMVIVPGTDPIIRQIAGLLGASLAAHTARSSQPAPVPDPALTPPPAD